LRLSVATIVTCILSGAVEAPAHVRVPDFSHLDRKKEAGEPRGLDQPSARAPAEKPAAKDEASRNAKQVCRGWEAGNPFAAFAGFIATRNGDAVLPFVDVKLVGAPDAGASSDETASFHQILSLLDDLNATNDIVEVAEGTTREGVACPLYVSIGDGDRKQTFWRFAPQDEPEGWFDETGRRLGGAPLAQPKPGSRISSTFGPRRYYGRLTGGGFHDGIDFESRVGEPVFAAADGVIDHEGWYFEYGLTIKIRHAPQFTTLYAHLSKFANGLTLGSMVRKGDLIGYVGMTGRSTGAHLHFSAIADGRFVDPAPYLSDKRDRSLNGPALAAFRVWQKEIEAAVAANRREHVPPREVDWTIRT
jgi:murein DD-endopeptidase MepM/ murein hydrolase activator NlpD